MSATAKSGSYVKVVIVDDHEMVRDMFRRVFEMLGGYRIVNQARNGFEALKICLKEKPDLILLDASMPELNGLETLRELTDKLPRSRFLVVSGSENDELPLRFIQTGAHGFISKTEPLQTLVDAIHTVTMGGNYFRSKQKDLLQQALKKPGAKELLTAREKQVLQLIAEGFMTKEIAGKLGVSFKTAETHRTNLMRKLDIHDVAGLTRYAIRS